MNAEQIHQLSEKHENEFLKFDRVENKRSQHPDIHAMLLLAESFPFKGDVVAAAEHDQIWFRCGSLDNITEEQIIELLRCGISFDEDTESFYSFV